VLLTDVGAITGRYTLDAAPAAALAADLLGSELLLLTGAYNADGTRHVVGGTWDTRILQVSLFADGNDRLAGDAGDDALFGQRGNDTLDGGSGDDYVEGDAGHDTVAGGAGNDHVVGDEGRTVVTPEGAQPNVVQGLHVIATATLREAAAGIALGRFGTVVAPMMVTTPVNGTRALVGLLPHLTGGVTAIPVPNAFASTDGASVVPFVAVVPQVAGHLHLLDGNDLVSGGDGDDVVIGDSSTVLVPTLTATPELLGRAHRLTADVHEVSERWADLAHAVHHAVGLDADHHNDDDGKHGDHPIVMDRTFTIGQDTVDGGAGADVVIGDDSTVLAPSITVAVGQVHDLHHLVHELDDVDDTLDYAGEQWGAVEHHLRDVVRQVVQGKKLVTQIEHHVDRIFLGSDLLRGGDGNDYMIGDGWSYLAPTVTVVPGGTPAAKHDHHWHGDDHDDEHHHAHHNLHKDDALKHWHHHGAGDEIILGNDTLDGGAGNDLLLGDEGAVAAPVVATPGVSVKDLKAMDREPGDIAWDVVDLGDHHHEHHHDHHGWDDGHDDGHDHDDDRVSGGNDVLLGGDGDDVVFGQAGQDTLRGGNGDDWLLGGDDKDVLDDTVGKNKKHEGNDNGEPLRRAVAGRLIDWSGRWSGFGGLKFPSPTVQPFSVDFEDDDEDGQSEILTFVIGPAKPKSH
jgi:Ca2+-binding RTX toxin-like protein